MIYQTGTCIRVLERFEEPVSCCVWAGDSRTFILGTFDKEKPLCQWNLEGERLYTWTKKHRTEDLAVSADGRYMVAMDDQNHLHVYNFITRELEYEMELKSRPTSVRISEDSRFLLVNKTEGEAQLIDIVSRDPIQKYTGHSGGEYTIRSSFGGANESFVISGSEGKRIPSAGVPGVVKGVADQTSKMVTYASGTSRQAYKLRGSAATTHGATPCAGTRQTRACLLPAVMTVRSRCEFLLERA
jgi:WD40 repeat protein